MGHFGIKGQKLGTLLGKKVHKNLNFQNLSIIKVVLLFLNSEMKKKIEGFRRFLMYKNDLENQNCAMYIMNLLTFKTIYVKGPEFFYGFVKLCFSL